eukprot:1152599-Pelagomonas_calceolata.AAC.3
MIVPCTIKWPGEGLGFICLRPQWGPNLLEVKLQRGVPKMTENSLWPLATFLHAPDIIEEMFMKVRSKLAPSLHFRKDCSFSEGTHLEASCTF